MSTNVNRVVVRDIELATYLISKRINGEVEIEFDVVKQTGGGRVKLGHGGRVILGH